MVENESPLFKKTNWERPYEQLLHWLPLLPFLSDYEIFFKSSLFGPLLIECFHMTSRQPYWCPKTMKRRPCWCPKLILWELVSFLMQKLSFVQKICIDDDHVSENALAIAISLSHFCYHCNYHCHRHGNGYKTFYFLTFFPTFLPSQLFFYYHFSLISTSK